MDKLKLASRI